MSFKLISYCFGRLFFFFDTIRYTVLQVPFVAYEDYEWRVRADNYTSANLSDHTRSSIGAGYGIQNVCVLLRFFSFIIRNWCWISHPKRVVPFEKWGGRGTPFIPLDLLLDLLPISDTPDLLLIPSAPLCYPWFPCPLRRNISRLIEGVPKSEVGERSSLIACLILISRSLPFSASFLFVQESFQFCFRISVISSFTGFIFYMCEIVSR